MSKTIINIKNYETFQLPTLYQQQIHLTKYSRWNDDLSRRETWPETVYRYLDFMINHIHTNFGYTLTEQEQVEIFEGILHLHVMPSMRAMMTAGHALEFDNAASFNCSFIVVDDLKSHDEAFYLSMCSVGVGFSVERQFTNICPDLPKELHKTDTTIVVPDTRIGWASCYRQLLGILYNGFVPNWDVSRVRPQGARLKTFGGRASGPGPLVDLFNYTVKVISEAVEHKQRNLTSFQHHDLMTKMADVAVSGGVRRAAMISLSNPSDERMRDAKSGQWWERYPHFRLANNSAVWTDMPEAERFMSEFLALVKSQSGERGIINREALYNQCKRSGRVDVDKYKDVYGVNPCFSGETLVVTNNGAFPISELINTQVNIWDGLDWRAIDNFRVTGQNQPILKITIQDGSSLRVTLNHTMILQNGGRVKAIELRIGDDLATSDIKYNGSIEEKGAYIKGFLLGDGSLSDLKYKKPVLILEEPKHCCKSKLIESASEIPIGSHNTTTITVLGFRDTDNGMQGITSRSYELSPWCYEYRYGLPDSVFRWNQKTKCEFLSGLFDADGTVRETGYQLTSSHKELLQDVQTMLKSIGVQSKLAIQRYGSSRPILNRVIDSECKDHWALTIGQSQSLILSSLLSFHRLKHFNKTVAWAKKSIRGKIIAIEEDGVEEEVYCCTVTNTHSISLGIGVITGQCSEVILRPRQMCNLTTSILRHNDTLDDIVEKNKLATILGTLQSTLTNFRYLSSEWKRNCEEERLLGVSLNGIMDNRFMAGLDYIRDGTYLTENFVYEGVKVELPGMLEILRDVSISTNKEWADKLGINESASITCIKPEGNNSNLVDCRPGLHGAHSRDFYIRTNRANKVDRMASFMIAKGVYAEDDVSSPDTAHVLYFPIKVPDNAISRHDYTAIEHLQIWRLYQNHYCQHKPSITVSVKDREWPSVAAFVYENFDIISGVAFLPFDGGNYRQAPYQECTREEWDALVAKTPTEIDWSQFSEDTDWTDSAKEYACVGNACSL